jgi:hypothetical protein
MNFEPESHPYRTLSTLSAITRSYPHWFFYGTNMYVIYILGVKKKIIINNLNKI